MKIVLDRTYTDVNNVEIQYGDILKGNIYPFLNNEGEHNYYGIVAWCEEDEDVVIRTTVSDNDNVSGISDGNCEYLKTYAVNKRIEEFEIIGNVKNKDDVEKYLRVKNWCYDDCVPEQER